MTLQISVEYRILNVIRHQSSSRCAYRDVVIGSFRNATAYVALETWKRSQPSSPT
jgi:hypothetical protein